MLDFIFYLFISGIAIQLKANNLKKLHAKLLSWTWVGDFYHCISDTY